MKSKFFIIVFIMFSGCVFSQKKHTKKEALSCKEIDKTYIDSSLYDSLSNGKLVFRPDKAKSKLYQVVRSDNSKYYVSKPIMKIIRRSIRKNKCRKIKVGSLDRKSDINFEITRG